MKYQDFKKAVNSVYFTTQDLRLKAPNLYSYQLSLWKKKGYIRHLKRGVYFFVDSKQQLSREEVAFVLYEPSYMSMEQVLGSYGIIPDIVHAVTSISTKSTRTFSNDFGTFIYRHIKPELFFGYTVTETPHGKFAIAQPEKALLDYLYFNLARLHSSSDIDAMRFNIIELKKNVSKKIIQRYLKEFGITKLEQTTYNVLRQC